MKTWNESSRFGKRDSDGEQISQSLCPVSAAGDSSTSQRQPPALRLHGGRSHAVWAAAHPRGCGLTQAGKPGESGVWSASSSWVYFLSGVLRQPSHSKVFFSVQREKNLAVLIRRRVASMWPKKDLFSPRRRLLLSLTLKSNRAKCCKTKQDPSFFSHVTEKMKWMNEWMKFMILVLIIYILF